MAKARNDEIRALKALADRPVEQVALARAQLKPANPRDLLQAALAIVADRPDPASRAPVLTLLRHYMENGPVRDSGGYMRRSVLTALRPLATPADLPLLLAAVNAYEFLPPDFKEEAILVRAPALVVLAELDEELARYHAVRLLGDGYTDPMSGEPALTAARVLASLDETVALYSYAMRRGGALPEVVSECLRSLTELPVPLVPDLIDLHRESKEAIVLVGLFDLLLNHAAGPLGRDFLAGYLAGGGNVDAYRYLAITVIARGDDPLIEALLLAARTERNPDKLVVDAEVLTLLPADPEIVDLRAQVEARLQPRWAGRR